MLPGAACERPSTSQPIGRAALRTQTCPLCGSFAHPCADEAVGRGAFARCRPPDHELRDDLTLSLLPVPKPAPVATQLDPNAAEATLEADSWPRATHRRARTPEPRPAPSRRTVTQRSSSKFSAPARPSRQVHLTSQAHLRARLIDRALSSHEPGSSEDPKSSHGPGSSRAPTSSLARRPSDCCLNFVPLFTLVAVSKRILRRSFERRAECAQNASRPPATSRA